MIDKYADAEKSTLACCELVQKCEVGYKSESTWSAANVGVDITGLSSKITNVTCTSLATNVKVEFCCNSNVGRYSSLRSSQRHDIVSNVTNIVSRHLWSTSILMYVSGMYHVLIHTDTNMKPCSNSCTIHKISCILY